MNKDRKHYGFIVGQTVYMYNHSESQLLTDSRKVQCHFVGHLAIYKCISTPTNLLLMCLDAVLYPMVVEEARLKPALTPTNKGPVRTISELKRAAKLTYIYDSQ